MEKWYAGYEEYPNFKFFDDILQIPRGSFHEEKIADYLEEFAKKRKLDCFRDELGNIIIKKPGSAGKENLPPLMLQAHTDMVCMKIAESSHDFTKDPIDVFVEDGWLKTKGTTLGADDGAGVALILSVLDDESLVNPPLECVFTVQEEDGMGGAKGLDFSKLSAKRMIGLDGLQEGATIFSASGVKAGKIKRHFENEKTDAKAYEIKVYGLISGHGGNNIGFGQANAIKIIGDILYHLNADKDINLKSINGGTMVHTIPPECEAVITSKGEGIEQYVTSLFEKLKKDYIKTDPNMAVSVTAIETSENPMAKADSEEIIKMLYVLPIGDVRRDIKNPERVSASLNVSIVKTFENSIEFDYVTRANKPLTTESLFNKTAELVKPFGGDFSLTFEYEGHSVDENSPMTSIWEQVYKEHTGKDLTRMYLHSGLDTGTIFTALDMNDVIVIVPDVADVHTPKERMSMDSFARAYKHLKAVVARA